VTLPGVVAATLGCVSLAACELRPPFPIIDMHMHAQAADFNGPPPLGICTPFPEFPVREIPSKTTRPRSSICSSTRRAPIRCGRQRPTTA